MINLDLQQLPTIYPEILEKCEEIGFTMPSDILVGSLLKSLVASKPSAQFLEIGTGLGLSLSWIIDGMDKQSKITSIDNDPYLVGIAQDFFDHDNRVDIIRADGSEWIQSYRGAPFDLIFADAWPGKYSEIEETLKLVKIGGFYVVDDMLKQPNWPKGHDVYVKGLINYLDKRDDLVITKFNWSTGIIVATKTK